MQAVTYARVSTAGQAEHGYSLAEQHARLLAHCETRGYRLVEHVADEGISGRLEERPGLRRLLDLAEAGAAQRVVAVNLTRVGREARVLQETLYQLRKRGVSVEFVEHGVEETDEGEMLLGMLGNISEYEWKQIRKRTMKGRYQKAEQKQVMPNGAAPYGFRAVTKAQAEVMPEFEGRSGEYLIEEDEAQVVREMFRRCAHGSTLRSLESWAQEAGITAPRGGPFRRTRIQEILRNPAYMGKPSYAGRELACPAIVDEPLFAAVQDRLEHNRERLRGRATTAWPLRGCVTCGHCQTARGEARTCVGVNPTRGRRHYTCASRMDRGQFCGSRFAADDLEGLVREALRIAATPGRLVEIERHRAEAAAKAAGDPQAQIKKAKTDLAGLDSEEEKVMDLALQGFSKSVVDKKLADIQQRRKQAQDALTAAQGTAKAMVAPEAVVRHAEELEVRLKEAMEDPERLMALAREVVRVTLFRDDLPLIEVRVPAGTGR